MRNYVLCHILLFMLFIPQILHAQNESTTPDSTEVQQIEIIHSDLLSIIRQEGEIIQKLIGKVEVKQDSTLFFCDSAYYYQATNRLEAFSNVRIEMPDSVLLVGDKLTYEGGSRIAEIFYNIVLTDSNVSLFTDHLTYYRNDGYGKYTEGGQLVDEKNVLTSILGEYYPKEDLAYFKDSVSLVNDEYTLTTDTLSYNTETKIAYFLAPTSIINEDGELLTNDGFYDSDNKKVNLYQRPTVKDSTYTLSADTLLFNNYENKGYAIGRVKVEQEDSTLQLWGNYGILNRTTDEAIITEEAVAIQFMEDDTMYLFADTLYSKKDSVDGSRIFKAYYHVEMYMNEMQGISDSLVYLYSDSMITMYDDPILWSDKNQLTGDTVFIQLKNNQADSMWVGPGSFLVSEEDTVGYNQIKGKEMHARFRDNELVWLHVIGNSESLYFVKDENESYQGMNQALSQEMFIFLNDNAVTKINFMAQPDGKFHPIHKILLQTNKLEGMQWRITEKPNLPEIDFLPNGLLNIKRVPLEKINIEREQPTIEVDSLDKSELLILPKVEKTNNGEIKNEKARKKEETENE